MGENSALVKEWLFAKNSNGTYKYPLEMIQEMTYNDLHNPDMPKTDFDRIMSCLDNFAKFLEENNLNSQNVYNFRISDEGIFKFEVVNDSFIYEVNKEGKLVRKTNTKNEVQQVEETSDNGRVRFNGTFEGGFGLNTDLINAEREVKDSKGNVLYKEVYKKGSIEGKYDIIRIEPGGKQYKIGFAEKTQAGEIIEERNFEIDDNTQINYVYTVDSKGNRHTYTKAVDIKTKEVLFENTQKFKVINENHFVSEENGVKYDIQYSKDKVEVTIENAEKIEISIGENGVLDENMLPLLKQLSGSMYEAISKLGLKRLQISYNLGANGEYRPESNTLLINANVVKEGGLNTLLHELGHYIDVTTGIHDNKDIRSTFEAEREEFEKNATFREKQIMSNFIADSYTTDSALWETIAEINATVHGNKTSRGYELPEIYLQKYFPKTFAKIAEALRGGKVEGKISSKIPTLRQEKAGTNQYSITQSQIPALDSTLLNNIANKKFPIIDPERVGSVKDNYKFYARNHNGERVFEDNHCLITDKSSGKIIRECFFDKNNPQNNIDKFYSYSENGKDSTILTVGNDGEIASIEHIIFDNTNGSTIKIEYNRTEKIKITIGEKIEELTPTEFSKNFGLNLDYYNLIEHTKVDISVTKTEKSIKDITESKSNLSKTSTSDMSNFIFTPQDRFTGVYNNIASYGKLDISKYFDEDGIFHFNLEIKNEKGEVVRKINKARDWFYNEENNLLEIRDHETGKILISTDCADEYLDLLSDIQKAHNKGKISDKHFETYLSETMPIEKLRIILDSLSFYESLTPREKEALFNLLTSYKTGSRKFMTYDVKKPDGTIERTKTAWGARKALDKILEKSIINEDINVTRYEKDLGFFDSIPLHKLRISFGDAIRSLEGKSQEEIKQYIRENMSEAFEMNDPTSTFLNTETHYFARNSIKMNIKVSKGAKGIYLEDIRDQSKGSYESELLLKQNQAYIITDIRFEDGKTIIDITLLPKDIE